MKLNAVHKKGKRAQAPPHLAQRHVAGHSRVDVDTKTLLVLSLIDTRVREGRRKKRRGGIHDCMRSWQHTDNFKETAVAALQERPHEKGIRAAGGGVFTLQQRQLPFLGDEGATKGRKTCVLLALEELHEVCLVEATRHGRQGLDLTRHLFRECGNRLCNLPLVLCVAA